MQALSQSLEQRRYFFDHVDPAAQATTLEEVRKIQGNFFLVSRLDQDLELSEFKKICQMIPCKPKQFYQLA
jgi:hypothetical protein